MSALARVIFGDEAGAEIDVRIGRDQLRIGRDVVAAHRHEAHRLDAAGDDDIAAPARDALGGDRDRLEARCAETVHGERPRPTPASPARMLAMRATFRPCSASGIAQPRITSSISAGSRPGARRSASAMTIAARSSGRVRAQGPARRLADWRAHGRDDHRCHASCHSKSPRRSSSASPTSVRLAVEQMSARRG